MPAAMKPKIRDSMLRSRGGAALLVTTLTLGATAAPPAAPVPPAMAPAAGIAAAAPLNEPAAVASAVLPAAPVNLDFESGELGNRPTGWEMTAASERAGFGVEVSDENPFQGKLCALVHTIAFSRTPGASGTLVQRFDAGAYRGRRVRFRAALRTEPGSGTRARLWLGVERAGQQPGFFDSMADRPVTAAEWQVYGIVGDVAPDATRIGIGLVVEGEGRAWIDGAAFEVLGPAGAGDAPARPLGERALTDLIALTRLVGYLRYFHPSDQAAAADWGRFTAAAVGELDPTPGPSDSATTAPPAGPPRPGAELAAALERLLAPLAPTLEVFATGTTPPPAAPDRPPAAAAAKLRQAAWVHIGLGASGRPSPFSSSRQLSQPGEPAAGGLDPGAPFAADLGGGASCLLPLALYADDTGTLPHAGAAATAGPGQAAGSVPVAGSPPAAGRVPHAGRTTVPPAMAAALDPVPTRPSFSPTDRNARLAVVILAWNVLQHFDPRLPAGGHGWPAALAAALREAAAGSAGDDRLATTLRRLVAATDDGQATVVAPADAMLYHLPLQWDWIGERLVVTEVAAGAGDLHPGDAVLRIGGRDAGALIGAAAAEVAGTTVQWRRWRALARLALGPRDAPLALTVEAAGDPGRGRGTTPPAREVQVRFSLAPSQLATAFPRPQPAVREAGAGVIVADLGRLSESELREALPRLAKASGIVFDLRGYVRSTDLLLAHLIGAPLDAPAERVPVWLHPDRLTPQLSPAAGSILPAAPRLAGRLAFISSARDTGVAESFLATVARLHLGAIVGSPTGGASGMVDSAPLPGGYELIWTATRPAEGASPPGRAVEPTVPAAPTRRGLAAGQDELLDRALALVRAIS
jgi:hypothetical protein